MTLALGTWPRLVSSARRKLVLLICGATLALFLPPSAAGGGAPIFSEVEQFATGGSALAVAWGDADGDLDVDLGVGTHNGDFLNPLYYNNGDGTFTGEIRFGARATTAVAWGDLDNDGDLDMAVGNDGVSQSNRVSVNNGDGTFVSSNAFGTHGTVAMAWADYDLDGDLDLALGNGYRTGNLLNQLYENNGDGTFAGRNEFGAARTTSVAWGDYDGDGDPDLAVGNWRSQNRLYVNNGDGTFGVLDFFGAGADSELTAGIAWADADNDGDLDLAVSDFRVTAANQLYRNDGGTFPAAAQLGVSNTLTVAWADCNGDGHLDLAAGNGGASGQNHLYLSNGDGTYSESDQFGAGFESHSVAWGDPDRDGDLDLAVGNGGQTPNYLYVNGEDSGEYLSLRLVGHFHDLGAGYSNRDGLGAKVFAYESGFLGDPTRLLGLRELAAQGGWSSQNAVGAHFGLAGHSYVDVRIVWPGSGGSHLTQDLSGIAVGGEYVIHEGANPTSGPIVSHGAASSWLVSPNPTRGSTRIALSQAGGDVRRLEIFDAQGRLVKVLRALPSGGDGVVATTWNGHDERGARVSSGVYFVRAVGAESAGPSRVVVLR